MNQKLSAAVSSVLVLAAALPAAWTASAAAVLEEVVVTAQKREQSLQDVPLSVEAISGATMQNEVITNLADLKSFVPNLQMNQTGISNLLYIRGIGSGVNQGFEQSVGMYHDGIYRGRSQQSRMPFLDVERVEVLRGPQVILFGKNSIAGAINIISADPDPEFGGYLNASYLNFVDQTNVNGAVSIPIGDTFGVRLAGMYLSSDGYTDNNLLDRYEAQRDEYGGRVTLQWRPTDDIEATLKYEGGSFDSTGRSIEQYNQRPRQSPTPSPFNGKTYSEILTLLTGNTLLLDNTINNIRQSNGDFSDSTFSEPVLTINWDFGPAVLTSITGYSSYELDESDDIDYVGAVLFNATLDENFDQFSQELRLTSPAGERLEWIAGLYYQQTNLDYHDSIRVPSDSLLPTVLRPLAGASAALLASTSAPRSFQQDADGWSVFGQATWRFTDTFRATVGLRWGTEDKDATRVMKVTDYVGDPLTGASAVVVPVLYQNVFGIVRQSLPSGSAKGSISEDGFQPLVNVQWDVSDDWMLYASFTQGEKAGGFDARSNAPPADALPAIPPARPIGTWNYKPEKADSYEVGFKSTLLDGRATWNTSIYYTDYKDLQTSVFDGRVGFNVTNAGQATTQGFEMDGRVAIMDNLTLTGSLGYIDFEWNQYIGQCYTQAPASLRVAGQPGNCNYKGFGNVVTPEWTGVFGIEHYTPLGETLQLNTNLNVQFSSSYLTNPTFDPTNEQGSYGIMNLRVGLGSASGKWELAFLGQNLTDEQTVAYSNDSPLAYAFFLAPAYAAFVNPGRSLGMQLSLSF